MSVNLRDCLLSAHPECALALDVLKANGGRMTMRDWFAADPRLAGCTRGEKMHIVLNLRNNGCVERCCHQPEGRSRIIVWRAVR